MTPPPVFPPQADRHRVRAGSGPLGRRQMVGVSRGVTLVELVLTISLAGIIGIPTGLLIAQHLQLAMSSRDSTVAMQLARYDMEQVESLNNFCAGALALGVVTIPNYQGYAYTLTRAVSCQEGDCTCPMLNLADQGVKRIQLTLTRSGAADPLARLTSYRTKYVLFGSGL